MSSASRNLNPHETAQSAQAVYKVRLSDNVVDSFKNTRIKDKFILDGGAKFKGKSGIFRSESGFGVIGR